MKRVLGWSLFVVLLPFIGAGVMAYFVVDAVVFGWKMAEQWLEDWND